MSHFAKVVDGIVIKVIVAESEFFATFIDDSPGDWIQTSYHTRGGIYYDPATGQPDEDQSKSLRKNYAGVGYTYDIEKDAFIPPSPYKNWLLNETTCLWEAPIPAPNDGKAYMWDEDAANWVEMPIKE